MDDPQFQDSWNQIKLINDSLWPKKETPDVRWKAHISIWAAKQCLSVPGDFMECGTNTGVYAKFITDAVDLTRQKKKFDLCDTFWGVPTENLEGVEEQKARNLNQKIYGPF